MTSVEKLRERIQPIVEKEGEKLKQRKLLSSSLRYLAIWLLVLLVCYQLVAWLIGACYKFPLIYDKELHAHNDHKAYWEEWCTNSLETVKEIERRKRTDRCIASQEYIQAFVMARAIGSFLVSEINDKLGFIVEPLVGCSRNWFCGLMVGFYFAERIGKDWIFPILSSLIIALAALVSRYSWGWIRGTLQKRKNAISGDLPLPANSKPHLY